MIDYKYLALDLDSTLLNSDKSISMEDLSELRRVKKNLRVILCSSRSAYSTKYISEAIGVCDYIMAFNGAVIMNSDRQVMLEENLKDTSIKQILQMSNTFDLEVILYSAKSMFIKEVTNLNRRWLNDILPLYKNNIGSEKKYREFKELSKIRITEISKFSHMVSEKIIKIVVLPTNSNFNQMTNRMVTLADELFVNLNITSRYIEITSKAADKSSSFVKLLKKNESIKDVIAIGDNMNDEKLIKKAGLGIAMKNAIQSVKDVADVITDDNDNNGVGKILKEIYGGRYETLNNHTQL